MNVSDNIKQKRIAKYLDYTANKARIHHSGGKQRIWAVALDNKNRIIAESGNHYLKTHPLQARYANMTNEDKKINLHAEIGIVAILLRLNKTCHSLYIARVSPNNDVLLAKPCKICQEALNIAGIKNIHWT
ncbi:MAG: hypothetical protein WC981_02760 [Candidatus Dojkabacteria bacterium]